jgi:hypothetical protein
MLSCGKLVQKSSDGLLPALRDHLCKMLDTDFREHTSLLKKSESSWE